MTDSSDNKKRRKYSTKLSPSGYKRVLDYEYTDINVVSQNKRHNAICEANQAERIIAKFGGPRALKEAIQAVFPDININMSTIYRWTYDKNFNSGTGGVIPPRTLDMILAVARYSGVYLSDRDVRPTITMENKRYLRKIGEYSRENKHGIKEEYNPYEIRHKEKAKRDKNYRQNARYRRLKRLENEVKEANNYKDLVKCPYKQGK